MRKFIIGSVIGLAFSFSTFATSFSVTVAPGTMTNVFSAGPNVGPILVKQVIWTSATATNSSFALYDCPSNSLTYVNPAYTNKISYATNYVQVWTNFYGVVQSNNYVGGTLLTNFQLVDITNNLVASTTNSYPIRLAGGAGANATVIFGPNIGGQLNGYYFDQGIWCTNTIGVAGASGPGIITIVY